MKISRERVGEELDKMMGGMLTSMHRFKKRPLNAYFSGRNPLLAIDLINVLSLYSSVFSVPENTGIQLSEPPSSLQNALKAAVILHALSNPESSSTTLSGLFVPPLPAAHPLLLSELTTQNSPSRRLYLAAALTPYRNLIYTQKNKMHPATEAVLRDGLKLGVQYNYSNGIPALFAAADVLQKGVADFEAGNMDKPERVWIGAWYRYHLLWNPLTC